MKNRLGKFYVTSELADQNPQQVSQMFAMMKAVVVRCERMYWNRFEYVAMSPMFEVVPVGNTIPEYKVNLSYGPEGELIDVEVEKV